MPLFPNGMKRKFHRLLLGLSLLVIIPGAVLALILLSGGIGAGFQKSFSGIRILALPFLILPSVIGWWGIKLMFRLRERFSGRSRKVLMLYHGSVLCYCTMWLLSAISDHAAGDGGSPFFETQDRIIAVCLLAIPLLATLFTSPEGSCCPSADRAEE